jgi:hypothetical protein
MQARHQLLMSRKPAALSTTEARLSGQVFRSDGHLDGEDDVDEEQNEGDVTKPNSQVSKRLIRPMAQRRGSLHFGTRRVELEGRQGGLYGSSLSWDTLQSLESLAPACIASFGEIIPSRQTSRWVSDSG